MHAVYADSTKSWKVASTCRGVKLEKTIRAPLSITLLENVERDDL
jgi:hypothetical protein